MILLTTRKTTPLLVRYSRLAHTIAYPSVILGALVVHPKKLLAIPALEDVWITNTQCL